ncbi:DUF1631 family protein [Actimicrobium antarcticum]|uniref:DUF1631 domain-containing protein n=1 Tax=Actimicrobium antarcticum TaxID=1051899 RepID=A0ABP7U040_9BURK
MSQKPDVPPSEAVSAASSRIMIMESLVPVAVNQVAAQMMGFTDRLAHAMFRLSDQSVLPNEASLSFHSWNHLKKNATHLHRGVVGNLGYALLCEIAALDKSRVAAADLMPSDLSLVSLDEMENKVLIGNIAQAIELDNAAALVALNIRLSRLLQREEISVGQNPFRPAVFLRATFEAWCKFHPQEASHRLILRLMRPDVFVDFGPVLEALNQALIARGIVPDLADVARSSRTVHKPAELLPDAERRDVSLQSRLQRWLHQVSAEQGESMAVRATETGSADYAPALSATSSALLDYLTDIQRTSSAAATPVVQTTATLRSIPLQAPAGSLTALDQNTIELLARVFDFVFGDPAIPDQIKHLLGRLQVPLLKIALADKDFFFSESYPARRLLDQLAQSGVGLQRNVDAEDPLFKLIEQIVERVQRDYDQQIGLYSNVVSDLDTFLAAEQCAEQAALTPRIADALRQERMQQAQAAADNDVASRIDGGEVAGFVEVFLETQWTRILTMAHSVAARKPEALEKALKAMDDLIWSVQPKVSPEERKELVGKLPSLLSLINAWLNAIKWDEPERVEFFSNLVERHAAIVRVPAELSPRRQLEMAVNIAQKASDRRLSKRAREHQEQPIDQFVHSVDSIELGRWVEFVRANRERIAYRLVWISPMRSRFIFSSRAGSEPLSMTAAELAAALREQGALMLPRESVIARALAAALDGAERAAG